VESEVQHELERLVSFDEAVGAGSLLEEERPLYLAQGIEVEEASE
jgi:ADP-heptose:LPS heptosyltransferase